MGEVFISRRQGGIKVTFEDFESPPTADDTFQFVTTSTFSMENSINRIESNDATHVYVVNAQGGGSVRWGDIRKFTKDNLTFVTNAPRVNSPLLGLSADETFVYGAGYNQLLRPYKWFKSNLALAATGSTNYGDWIEDLAIDESFVYCVGLVVNNIRKYHIGNLVSAATSGSYGGWIFAIAVDDSFAYVGGNGAQDIKKYHKGNLAFAGATNSFGSNIGTIRVDETHIYVGSRVANTPLKTWFKDNLSYAGATNIFTAGLGHAGMRIDNTFLYVSALDEGTTDRFINQYYKSNLNFFAKSDRLGTDTFTGGIFTIDDGFIYASGGNATVVKIKPPTGEEIPGATEEKAKAIIEGVSYIREDLI